MLLQLIFQLFIDFWPMFIFEPSPLITLENKRQGAIACKATGSSNCFNLFSDLFVVDPPHQFCFGEFWSVIFGTALSHSVANRRDERTMTHLLVIKLKRCDSETVVEHRYDRNPPSPELLNLAVLNPRRPGKHCSHGTPNWMWLPTDPSSI